MGFGDRSDPSLCLTMQEHQLNRAEVVPMREDGNPRVHHPEEISVWRTFSPACGRQGGYSVGVGPARSVASRLTGVYLWVDNAVPKWQKGGAARRGTVLPLLDGALCGLRLSAVGGAARRGAMRPVWGGAPCGVSLPPVDRCRGAYHFALCVDRSPLVGRSPLAALLASRLSIFSVCSSPRGR